MSVQTGGRTGVTIKAGLIGRGIRQSRTPRMHESEGARLGFGYEYRLFDLDILGLSNADLPILVEKLRAEGYAGLNITHPFKETVLECLDRLSPEAESIGAVNTVVFQGAVATGHNTDCWGFAESFKHGLAHAPCDRVVLVGAGGAGMAVAKALLDLGAAKVMVADSNHEKATRLAHRLGDGEHPGRTEAVTDLADALARADGLVNATPVGMAKYPGTSVRPEWLRPDLWVADIVYFPMETELLSVAKARGCRTLPGAGMAIFQAVRAFELITGSRPDPEHMATHFHSA